MAHRGNHETTAGGRCVKDTPKSIFLSICYALCNITGSRRASRSAAEASTIHSNLWRDLENPHQSITWARRNMAKLHDCALTRRGEWLKQWAGYV
eukprot:scaffold53090_cov57-Cyclotella_meneghiniana.AAC.1